MHQNAHKLLGSVTINAALARVQGKQGRLLCVCSYQVLMLLAAKSQLGAVVMKVFSMTLTSACKTETGIADLKATASQTW